MAAEERGGTVQWGRAATVRSLEMMERDRGEVWRCQTSVVHGERRLGKATKVT